MSKLKEFTCALCEGTAFVARACNLTITHHGVDKEALVCRGCADYIDIHPVVKLSRDNWDKRSPSVSFDFLPVKVRA